jgi:signal transduction histidine kinase/CheY-like chemotaxis protein
MEERRTTLLEAGSPEERVLILAPTGRDAVLACQLLTAASVPSLPCLDEEHLFHEIAAGAGTAILADEALHPGTINGLLEVLSGEGPWSDLPVIVFTRGSQTGEDILERLGPLGNATILERPVRLTTLLSAVKASLRARRRQYQVRDLLRRQSEADRRKDEFLALLGHELRNPLAAIRNALWLLEEMGSKEERAARQREVIQRQTGHLVRMVDDLLDVSRVTLGKILLKKQPVDLADVVRHCLDELGMEALARTRGLRLSVRTEPLVIQGDPVRLEQVVCNLLQNAIKYTPSGGEIWVSAESGKDAQAVIRVRDTGIGLAPEMLTTIFEPFIQVENSRQRADGGLGLGLPLVRGLVELHEGEIEAKSHGPGQGSEFIVHLPLLRSGQKARHLTRRAEQPGPGAAARAAEGLRVLIVEDNEDGRESMRELLEIWGHQIDLADNGPQGIEKALSGRPEVALIDIGLPGLDGNEVARRIRAVHGSHEISLIAMTGYGQPEDRRRALQAGFDAYLIKPVDPAVLSRLLDEAGRRAAPPPLPA